ncbi:hypothetical protein Q3G72_005741 [Acer saccharum]|nr:hypothetical protein Q3G72_005741 [Acer saccharum]
MRIWGQSSTKAVQTPEALNPILWPGIEAKVAAGGKPFLYKVFCLAKTLFVQQTVYRPPVSYFDLPAKRLVSWLFYWSRPLIPLTLELLPLFSFSYRRPGADSAD